MNKIIRALLQWRFGITEKLRQLGYIYTLVLIVTVVLVCLLWAGVINAAEHRIYIGAGMLSDRTSTLTPYVMYDREGRDDWHFQVGYAEYAQLSLIKHFGSGHFRGYFGLSYIPSGLPRDVQCSQGNARSALSFEVKQFSVAAWHDSNMRVCRPNTGFNFITAGYKFAKPKSKVSEQFGVQ